MEVSDGAATIIVPSKLSPEESGIEQWLVDAGIGSVPGLPTLLARLGGGGVDELGNVNEAELLVSVGKLGLKGVRLRKLLAALNASSTYAVAPSDEPTPDVGTGGSAFEYLVAKDGPPPSSTTAQERSPAQRTGSDTAGAAMVSDELTHEPPAPASLTEPPVVQPAVPTTPPAVAPSEVAASSTFVASSTPPELSTPPPATPTQPFTLTLPNSSAADTEDLAAPVFNFTPRTVEAIKVASGVDEVPPGIFTPRTIEAVKVAHQEVDDETIALQMQLKLDEEASASIVEQTLELAKSSTTKGKPVKKKKSPTSKKASASVRKSNAEKSSVKFHVDVGESKMTTSLDKKVSTILHPTSPLRHGRTPPHRTAQTVSYRTAPHRTAPHRSSPASPALITTDLLLHRGLTSTHFHMRPHHFSVRMGRRSTNSASV